ncbi:hypothetical protein GG344DRAFT_78377 [Lentinula edodes]|nr:hypothetical protein GG344DRAFT_78377 [Lentinula edodes]
MEGNRCVCLNVIGREGSQKPGIYETMRFMKGGYKQPPLPLNIQCHSRSFAKYLYGLLQPLANRYYRESPDSFVDKFTSSEEFQEVATAANEQVDLVWVVKYGKFVGIFFEGLDAISSVDEAQESKWQQAFAFRTFKEAVVFQLGSIKNPDHHVWEYNPREQPNAADEIRQLLNVAEVEPPSTPPAPATPPRFPRPMLRSLRSPNPDTPPPTPSRRNRSQAEGTSVGTSFVASPQITVHVNQDPLSAGRRSLFHTGAYWSRRILRNLQFDERSAGKVEDAIRKFNSKEEFLQWFNTKCTVISEDWAELLWDLHSEL